MPPQRVISRRGIRGAKTPRTFVIRQTWRRPGQFGALGFYHLRVFLPVLTRAFADFSLLSLLSPKMRSQSLLEIPLNPTRKRSWCSSVFGFDVDVGVDVGVGVGVDVGVVSSVIFVSLPTNGHYDFYKTWKSIPLIKRYRASYFTFTISSRLRLSSFRSLGLALART